jgi:hypothetical protein
MLVQYPMKIQRGNFELTSPTTGFKNNPSIATFLYNIAPEEHNEITTSINIHAMNLESSGNTAFFTTRHF